MMNPTEDDFPDYKLDEFDIQLRNAPARLELFDEIPGIDFQGNLLDLPPAVVPAIPAPPARLNAVAPAQPAAILAQAQHAELAMTLQEAVDTGVVLAPVRALPRPSCDDEDEVDAGGFSDDEGFEADVDSDPTVLQHEIVPTVQLEEDPQACRTYGK